MNRSRVKRFTNIFLFFYFYHIPSLYPCPSCVLPGPAAVREWATNKLVGVWPPQTSRTQSAAADPQLNNANAANQTECVFQTPIRADHQGRYIRLTTGRPPILCDVMPFSSTLHYDRDDRRFAAFVTSFMPLSPILYNV